MSIWGKAWSLITSPFGAAKEDGRSLENPRTPLDPWNQAAQAIDGMNGIASSGVRVSRQKALTVAAVWRAVHLISDAVAKLPLGVYREDPSGQLADPDHPAYRLLRYAPNEMMTPFVVKQLLTSHALIEGNGYAYIFRDRGGRPVEILPLDPQRTEPVMHNGELWYLHKLRKNEEVRKLRAEDVLHIKGLGYDGLRGYAVLTLARETLGLAVATTTYGATFFRNNARPNAVLKHPGKLSKEARNNLRDSWERLNGGLDNSHRTAVLEEGLDIKELTINARDSQLIESKQFSLVDVANWFGVPPNKLGANVSTSYGSLEQDNQHFLDHGVDPWLVLWEEECQAKLLSSRERLRASHGVAFDRFPLQRADLDKRANYYSKAIAGGWMAPDEARKREGDNPMPGGLGRVYFRPLNLQAVGGDPDGVGPRVAPGARLLDLPDVRQAEAWDCGPAATLAVLRYFERGPDDLPALVDALGTTPEAGTKPGAIASYLGSQGLTVTTRLGLDLEHLHRFYMAGQPVLCPCRPTAEANNGHWVVVIGLGLGQVFLHDPMTGRRMLPEADWLAQWRDTDADGRVYERYGIAVGLDLLPREVPTPAEGPDRLADQRAGPPADPAAARAVLLDAIGRVVRRLRHRAIKAAHKPSGFLDWLTYQLRQDDRNLIEMLDAPVGLWAPHLRAGERIGEVVDDLTTEVKNGLLKVSGEATASQLAGAVERWFDEVESDLTLTRTVQGLLKEGGA